MARKRKRPAPSAIGWAFFLLFFLVTGLFALWALRPLKEKPRPAPPEEVSRKRPPRSSKPLPLKKPPQRKSTPPGPKKPKETSPKPIACIIIDDMGQNPRLERKFFELGLVLNFSFLPHAPFTKRLATEAHARGFEVLVHLPLEARKTRDASAFISLRMGEVEVKRRVREAVRLVPYAIGINHHMGSAFSAERTHMRWVLEETKALGLIYVDSRTTPKTVVPELARALGLPFAERRVFLDHRRGTAAVVKALDELIRRAQKRGPTLAIGHPHPDTLKALTLRRPRLTQEVSLVPLSVFVRKVNAHDQRTPEGL